MLKQAQLSVKVCMCGNTQHIRSLQDGEATTLTAAHIDHKIFCNRLAGATRVCQKDENHYFALIGGKYGSCVSVFVLKL